MPVYNSEAYLKNAVMSVLNQDFDGFELILVDDGSKDSSGKICDEFGEKYNNVKVVHKQNGGICSARNAGIMEATGEYIGFCDNDDEYLPDLIKDNYELAKANDVDLMRYAKIKRAEKDDGRVFETISRIEDMFIDRKDFYKHYNNIRREDTVWTGFYRRSIINENNIRFDESYKYGSEDLNFNLKFLNYCEKLGFNSKAYYSWTQRDSHSTSRSFRDEFLDKGMVNIQLEYEFMKNVCGGKVNNTVKNIFLVNSYIYPTIDYMEIKNCNLSLKEKCKRLDRLRSHKIFDKKIPKKTCKRVWNSNKRIYLTMRLFEKRRYKLLIFILSVGTSILSHFRFKK